MADPLGFHLTMTIDLSSFAASSLATPGFSKTSIAKVLPALAKARTSSRHCKRLALTLALTRRQAVVQESRPCFASFGAIFEMDARHFCIFARPVGSR
jgi:hypothetical protein